MALPEIDERLEQPLLTAAEHWRRNWIPAVLVTLYGAFSVLAADYFLLCVTEADHATAWLWMTNFVPRLLAWVAPLTIAIWAAIKDEAATDGKLNSTWTIYERDLNNERDHAREQILQDRLTPEAQKHIYEVLEAVSLTRFLNRAKWRARRFTIAWVSFLPWLFALLAVVFVLLPATRSAYPQADPGGMVSALTACLAVTLHKGLRFWKVSDDWYAIRSMQRFNAAQSKGG